jgi:hypothetical protein
LTFLAETERNFSINLNSLGKKISLSSMNSPTKSDFRSRSDLKRASEFIPDASDYERIEVK